jgi:hypothetical protein
MQDEIFLAHYQEDEIFFIFLPIVKKKVVILKNHICKKKEITR